MVDKGNIQGLVFSGYGAWPAARFRLLRITDAAAARAWLAEELNRLTYGSDSKAEALQASSCRNLAFTYAGLVELGLPADALRGFDAPFREGMADFRRSQVLGDLDGGPSDPTRWKWGRRGGEPVHLLQMLYAVNEAEADDLCAAEAAATGGFLHDMVDTDPHLLVQSMTEHFGFSDGVSQPRYRDVHRPAPNEPLLATGELLLGHLDASDNVGAGPLLDPAEPGAHLLPPGRGGDADFGKDGAYLICRQMRQDVKGFHDMLERVAGSAAVAALLPDSSPEERSAWAASRIIGRWRSGCPAALSPWRDDDTLAGRNDFLFEVLDFDGRKCPFGSHIRRANPRDSVFAPGRRGSRGERKRAFDDTQRRRLLRRGRAFGPDYREKPEAARGLMFVALCADIERQFEFVQRSWLLDANFAGLRDETDPLFGVPDTTLTLQAAPFAARLEGVTAHAWTEGGAYFFLPSRAAMAAIAAR